MPAEPDARHDPALALPGWSKQPSGLYLPLSVGVARVEALPPGLAEPPRPVVARKPTSWSDQISPWAESEVFGIPAMPVSMLANRFADLPLEPTMLALTGIQRALGSSRDLPSDQPQLVSELLFNSPLEAKARAFLRAYPRGVIFFEQQVYVAQKLALLHADAERDDDLTAEELTSLIISILAITSGVIDRANDPGLRTPTHPGQLLPMFFGGAHFAHREWIGATLTRALAVFEEAAADELRAGKQSCDLAAWLDDAYGLTLEELLAGGLGLAAAGKLLTPEELFQQVDAESLRPFLGEATDGVLAALVADRDWYQAEFATSLTDVRYLARDVTPFFKRPFYRRADGTVVALGPRVVQEALSDHGLYFRFHDLARSRKGGVQRYTNFAGKPYERYCLELARRAVERPKTSIELVARVHGEVRYRRGKKGQDADSPDVTIGYGSDVVMVEVTTSHLTQETLIEATLAAVKKDIAKIVTNKLTQLDDRIRDARKGYIELEGIDFAQVKRIWPILVITEPLLQTDLLWDEVQRACKNAFQHSRVALPTIMGIEEYECLMGDVKAGHSLIAILERKTQEEWAKRDFRSWHRDDPGALGEMGLPEQERRFGETMKRLLGRLQRDQEGDSPAA